MSHSRMCAARALIREAEAEGVRLWVAENRLHFKATRQELSESLRSRLRTSITELTGELSRLVVRRRPRTESVLRFPDLWLDFWQELQSNLTLANSTHAVLRLSGDISSESIAAAFQTLCQRHEILGARMELQGGVPCVLFVEKPAAAVKLVDLTAGAEGGDPDAQTKSIERAIWDTLENGAVFRARVVRISIRDCVVVFVVHHFVSDFTSCQILARELLELLRGKAHAGPLQVPPIQYFEYVSALNEWLMGPGPTYRLAYWSEQLRDAPETSLPVGADAAGSSGALEAVNFRIEPALRNRIAERAAEYGVTVADVTLAAHFLALSQVTERSDLLTVLIISGREDPSLARMVGSTIDCLPIRVRVLPAMSPRQLIQQAHTSCSLARHYRVPWSLLTRTLARTGIRCAAPLFNFIRGSGELPPKQFVETHSSDMAGLRVGRPPEQAAVDWKTHQLDVFDSGEMLFGSLQYDPARHRREAVAALRTALLQSLETLVRAGEVADR